MGKIAVAKCLKCKDILRSRRGEWVRCSCFRNEEGNLGIYIDNLGEGPDGELLVRCGGNLENVGWLPDEDSD